MVIGWKSIATTLGVSVRTAQSLGMPVFKLTPRLIAIDDGDLAAWVAARRCASLRDAALAEGMPEAVGIGT